MWVISLYGCKKTDNSRKQPKMAYLPFFQNQIKEYMNYKKLEIKYQINLKNNI